MADREGKKEESRARILASAGRGFRARGYGGLGVDGLAKDAGVTSGAFYAHFESKAVAFREAVAAGLRDLRDGIRHLRSSAGKGWRAAFVDFYMGERRTCDLSESCALQSLTGEVARADADAKGAYERELQGALDALTEAHGIERRDEAIALLALLSGGVSLARAVRDPAESQAIADAVRTAALGLSKAFRNAPRSAAE